MRALHTGVPHHTEERQHHARVASRSLSGPAAIATSGRGQGPLTYRVKRGDTLFSIARLFDTTVEELKDLNQLTSSRIHVGVQLTVRGD